MAFTIGEGVIRVTLNTAGTAAKLAALTSAAGAAGAALSALPALGASVSGIGGVLAGAFSGVGEALKGYQADQKAATKVGGQSAAAAQAQARQIRDAQQAVDDARRNAAKVAKDSAQRIQDALRDEARTARDVADDIEDAKENQAKVAERGAEQMEDASRKVADAMEDERRAQENLTEAREDAARQLEDLQERVSDYALDEEGALIRIEKAREKLLELEADSTTSALDLRDARHDLATAEERLSDLQRERTRDTAELRDAEAKGIDGSDKVTAAREKLRDAEERVAEAQKDASRTQRDVARANAEAAEKVAEAVTKGQERMADAERATARAREDAAEAQADANRAVTDALESLADAQNTANDSVSAGAGAVSKYAEAMAKLNPYQRELVKQLISMGPLVDRLKFAASETFLPEFTQMLRDSEGLFPIFEGHIRRTGEIMGSTAARFGDLFKSEEFKNNLDAMFKASDPITAAIGDSFVRLTSKIVEFAAKTDGTALGFSRFIGSVTTGLEGFFDKLAEHDDSFQRVWEALGRIVEALLPAVGEALGKLADIAAPIFEVIADFFTAHKDELDEWLLAILGFYTALKGLQVINGVSKMVGGVINEWKRLPPAAKKYVKLAAGALAALYVGKGAVQGFSDEQEQQFEGGNFFDDIGTFFNDEGGPIEALGKEIRASLTPPEETKALWGEFTNWWSGLWGAEGSISTSLVGFRDSSSQWFTEAKDRALGKLTEWRDGATTKASEILSGITTWFQQLPGRVTGWFTDSYNRASQWWESTRAHLAAKSGEIIGNITGWFQQLPGRISGWFTDSYNRAAQWWESTRSYLANKSGEIVGNITGWLQQLPGRVSGWFNDMYNRATSWLGNMATDARNKAGDIVNGITSWLSGLPDRVRDVFQRVRDWAIGKLIEIRDQARQPIDFVVNTIYHNGIRPVWNSIARVFGMPQLATGGIMPGYTPGRDVHLAALSGGEAVMRPEWTRAAGAQYVHAANAAARAGGVHGARRFIEQHGVPGYAQGGIIGDLWGKASGFLSSLWNSGPVQAVRGLFEGVLGDSSRIPGKPSWWKDAAQKVAPMTVDAVVRAATKWMETNQGPQGALNWARSQQGKPYLWGGVGPAGYDCSGFMSAILNVMRGRNPHARVGATGTFPWAGFRPGLGGAFSIGSFRGNPGHMAGTLLGVNVESRGSAGVVVGPGARGANHPMFNTHGHVLADTGGMLPHGMSALNASGRPERVLSPSQTAAFEQLVALLEQQQRGRLRGGPEQVHVHLEQASGSPAETGRFVSLALRGVG